MAGPLIESPLVTPCRSDMIGGRVVGRGAREVDSRWQDGTDHDAGHRSIIVPCCTAT